MAGARTLHVRCTTWEQVEVFVTRKLRKGRFLSMKVPFAAKLGGSVTLGLELPNELVIAIDGVVQRTSPVEGDTGTRTWIEIELTGLTEDVLARIRSLQKRAEQPEPDSDEIHIEADEPVPPPPQRKSQVMIAQAELPVDERELFLHLSGELRRMRQASVHQVLGVAPDASAEQVREAWQALIRKHHPDLVARRGAPAITHLAEELTILANRAYDRLRARLVAEGRGAAAGPAVVTPPGWLVGFEDIPSEKTPTPQKPTRPPIKRPASQPGATATPAASSPGGGDAFEARARAMLAQGDAATAREVLAAALVVFPRSKALRSLYYVATALGALKQGEIMLAQSQLETALAHYDQCIEAAQMLEHIRRHGAKNPEAMQRLFG